MEIYYHDLDRQVLCDICDKDYTDSNESGGYLFGSYAICPRCEDEHYKTVFAYDEEYYIKAFCPKEKSFADWVRQDLRANNKAFDLQPISQI